MSWNSGVILVVIWDRLWMHYIDSNYIFHASKTKTDQVVMHAELYLYIYIYIYFDQNFQGSLSICKNPSYMRRIQISSLVSLFSWMYVIRNVTPHFVSPFGLAWMDLFSLELCDRPNIQHPIWFRHFLVGNMMVYEILRTGMGALQVLIASPKQHLARTCRTTRRNCHVPGVNRPAARGFWMA